GFELRGDLRDILFLAAAKPAVLVGSAVRGGAGLLDYNVAQDAHAHQVLNAAAIAAAGASTGFPGSDGRPGAVDTLAPVQRGPREVRPPKLYLTPAHRAKARALLPDGGSIIALHLGAGFPSKQLPLTMVAAAAASLRYRDPQRRFVVVGGPEDQPLVNAFRQHIPDGVMSLAGQLSLLETAAVLERSRLFMGNDSAPMHLAAAVGVPIIAWFGPSEPWRFRPYGVPHHLMEVDLDCRPCDYIHCIWPEGQKYQCMTRQDVQAIVAAAEDLLRIPLPPTGAG
ncbi:MAG: glycosyl transferase family 9, partial [Dehalococcoidia bacterium]|nr:glycosyl transferase family 9 [Dehalococcoidia bacterium]